MSSYLLSPDWLTSAVRTLAVRVWGSGTCCHDLAVAPILADALQDAGCDDDTLLAQLRSPQQWSGCFGTQVFVIVHWPAERIAAEYAAESARRADIARRKREAEEAAERYAFLAAAAAAGEIARLEEVAATAGRAVSRRYWATDAVRLLRTHPGHVRVEYPASMRGTPPAGVIWVRGATSGRWGRSRAEKFGRKMTAAELIAHAEAQQEAAV